LNQSIEDWRISAGMERNALHTILVLLNISGTQIISYMVRVAAEDTRIVLYEFYRIINALFVL
jgi:hypothetical protein